MSVGSGAFDTLQPEFSISRGFSAPRELIFRTLTEAEHLPHWWGPAGMEMHVEQLDVRPGGLFLYRLTGSDGGEMWGKFVYHEIDPPRRIDYVSSFANAAGDTVRAEFSADFPLELANRITLTEQDGVTTLTLQAGPIEPTRAERDFFASMFDSMRQGYGGTLDQLEAYLERLGH